MDKVFGYFLGACIIWWLFKASILDVIHTIGQAFGG